jgi:DNA helicase-2/ATP-dependent DNA helicase PcrA
MSRDFLNFLECGACALEPEFADVTLEDKVIISAEQLLQRFMQDDENSPKARGERLAAFAQGVIEEFFVENQKEIYKAVDDETSFDEDTSKLVKRLKRQVKAQAVEMIKNAVLTDPLKIYIKLLHEYAEEIGNPHLTDTLERLKRGVVEFEDALGVVYVKTVLGTFAVLLGVKHILIDEAQDLSFVQHAIIKKMFPRARVTLLADTNQALIEGINTVNEELLADIYSAKTMKLHKSYRSTEQINEFALGFLPHDKKYEIFKRQGSEVSTISGNEKDLINKIKEESEKGKTLAVITKTAEQSRRLCKSVKKTVENIRLCDNKSCELSSAPVIMPLALTKGLEFDSVIVADESRCFSGEGNERFMYLASTRALHSLTVFEY